MIDQTKQRIKERLEIIYGTDVVTVEEPKKGHADLAIPLFSIAKMESVSPLVIFERIRDAIEGIESVQSIVFQNGFLNIFLERKNNSYDVITGILEHGQAYGHSKDGDGKTVVIDYSSPNIAKSFSVGHLRSTMIGNALKHIYRKLGYQVVGINHLGDWGTQFGKMIVAYHKWGNDEAINANPIATLQALYVRFHDEAERHPELENQARHALLRLEQGDPEHLRLWQWFKEESMKEFMGMYDMLGVSFDSFDGESFYNDKMAAVVDDLDDKGLLTIDDGATIVNLGEAMPPALIKRSDGGTLYITRDLAALLYRYRTYHFKKILYVVGHEQMLHFKQLKMVSDMMGYDFELDHINFGLVLIDGKKMSTRSGQFKRLEDVIAQAVDLAKEAITQKNPSLSDKDQIASAVAIGAIIFNDLKNERHLDVDFDLDQMLRFEGQTGPYLQYSSVRINSMIKAHTIDPERLDPTVYVESHYFELVKLLDKFPDTLHKAAEHNAPNLIARYLLTLAMSFNSFYGKQKVLVDDQAHLNANLAFVKAIKTVLDEGLRLLGINVLEEM